MNNLAAKTYSFSFVLFCFLGLGSFSPFLQVACAQAEAPDERTPNEITESFRALEAYIAELEQQGRYSEAIPLAEQVLLFIEKVRGPDTFDAALKMNALAVLYREQGEYDKALPLLERSLSIIETVQGADHLNVSTSLNNIASVYADRGNYDEARSLFERSIAIKEAALGPNDPEVAGALNNLAQLYVEIADYSAALRLHQRALSIYESKLGPDHLLVALSLNNLALLYGIQDKYDEALPLHERALSIRKAELGSNHPEVANSLSNLAALYAQQGNYRTALPLLEQVLSIQEATIGPNHPEFTLTLNNLAVLHNRQGNYDVGLSLYERSLSIREAMLGPDHPEVAFTLSNLAKLHTVLGNYDTALPLYERSLSIREAALGPDHPEVANSLSNLAELYQMKGEYSRVLPLYERSLSIREAVFGSDHSEVAKSLREIALLYKLQGNYVAALPLVERSLSIQEATLGPDHPEVAETLNGLATLYRRQGNYTDAIPVHERALAIREAVFGPDSPEVALSLETLASSYRQSPDKYRKAISLYERALTIREAVFGSNHLHTVATLINLAALHQGQGSFSEALPLFKQALSFQEAALGPNHPDIAVVLSHLVVLYQDRGDVDAALAAHQRLAQVEEQNLSSMLTSASEERRQRYIDTLAFQTGLTISFNLNYMPDSAAAKELSLLTVLQRKGRVLDATSNAFQQLSAQLTPENKTKLDELNAVRSAIANLHFSGQEKSLEASAIEQQQAKLAALAAQAETLEEQLARSSAAFRVETEPASISDVRAALPANAALVEFVRYRPFAEAATPTASRNQPPHYAAYILTEKGDVQAIDLGEAATVDRLISEFQQSLSARSSSVKKIGRALDERLMEPLRPLIGDTTHLLLSPDSHLNLIPFDALVDENDDYLIESYQISYLTSGRDLLKLQLDTPSQQPPVILANPDYSSSRAIAQPNPTARRSVDATNLRFASLPGTAIEAEAIAQRLPNATLLTKDRATESQLKQIQAPSILHIATHGFFLPDVEFIPIGANSRSGVGATIDVSVIDDAPAQIASNNLENPLLRSGLAFAGANARSSGRDDGIFTALEASGLNLHGTKLVVLSACETGVGSVSNGEGVYGLRRAFVIAGAQSQLMSLWQVDDTGTSELMQLYYENLMEKQQGRSEALRSAQLTMMNTGTYAHPYYWSSFIFSGDWRPL